MAKVPLDDDCGMRHATREERNGSKRRKIDHITAIVSLEPPHQIALADSYPTKAAPNIILPDHPSLHTPENQSPHLLCVKDPDYEKQQLVGGATQSSHSSTLWTKPGTPHLHFPPSQETPAQSFERLPENHDTQEAQPYIEQQRVRHGFNHIYCGKNFVEQEVAQHGSAFGCEDEIVCYGMLSDIKVENVRCEAEILDKQSAFWDGRSFLQNAVLAHDLVKLTDHTFQLLTILRENAETNFQFWVSRLQPQDSNSSVPASHNRKHSASSTTSSLSVIIFGPLSKAIIVGNWLDSAQMFLQMPFGCEFNFKYKNPHCLSFAEEPSTMTSELHVEACSSSPHKEVTNYTDFTKIYTDEVYEEATQPRAISSPLHKHQRVALTFLLEREDGWNFDSSRASVWARYTDCSGQVKYRNTISGRDQDHPPRDFQGGILADEMGLGKTCTMLSLIAADLERACELPADNLDCGQRHSGTLIVVPLPLLQVWGKQIQDHFVPGSITWKVFHGSKRKFNSNHLASYNIVITTYHTVTYEWKRHKANRNSATSNELFSNPWHRIILDEAHIIRNISTANAKSVCALQSDRKWCITGTPIQNRLSDIFGLLRFLNAEPYHKFKLFENDIIRPWRLQNDELAIMKLISLMKALSIRRPRTVISLPTRSDSVSLVTFTTDERSTYEKARQGAIDVLNIAELDSAQRSSAYINTLQRINEMRYICNHGSKPRNRRSATGLENSLDTYEYQAVGEVSNEIAESGSVICVGCGDDLQDDDCDESDSPSQPAFPSPTEALFHQMCKTCSSICNETSSPLRYALPAENEASPLPAVSITQTSSKIKALLAELQLTSQNEKSVVFSYWTSSLSAVAQALSESSIHFLRYDGRMSRAQRDQVLREFAESASTRVILVSISCGGQGLDLTMANNAFLLEPQWNPMLEEQAVARVHRLGQTKPVRLVRFVVEGTWEEKIKILQERKRSLVDLVIDKKNLKDGNEGKKQLHFLRELLV